MGVVRRWAGVCGIIGRMSTIGTLNEKPLHAALKRYLALPDDRFEVPLDRFVIDVVRGDPAAGGLLIEVQTGSFSPLKRKLRKLTEQYQVRLVFPIAAQKWIVKEESGKRRKSPKKGTIYQLFRELVYIPDLLKNPNFSVEVLLIEQEDVRRHLPNKKRRGRWRKDWVTAERRLVKVVERRVFADSADLLQLLPDALPDPFTTKQLAKAIQQKQRVAQQMMYCLRGLDSAEIVGKQGNANLYRLDKG